MLVFINEFVTSINVISRPSYSFIVAVKKSSSDAVGLEVSSLDNHYLVGFTLNTILPLSFFVVLFWSSIIVSSQVLLLSCGVNYLIEIG